MEAPIGGTEKTGFCMTNSQREHPQNGNVSNLETIEASTVSARTGILSANTIVNHSFIRIGMTNEEKLLLCS